MRKIHVDRLCWSTANFAGSSHEISSFLSLSLSVSFQSKCIVQRTIRIWLLPGQECGLTASTIVITITRVRVSMERASNAWIAQLRVPDKTADKRTVCIYAWIEWEIQRYVQSPNVPMECKYWVNMRNVPALTGIFQTQPGRWKKFSKAIHPSFTFLRMNNGETDECFQREISRIRRWLDVYLLDWFLTRSYVTPDATDTRYASCKHRTV